MVLLHGSRFLLFCNQFLSADLGLRYILHTPKGFLGRSASDGVSDEILRMGGMRISNGDVIYSFLVNDVLSCHSTNTLCKSLGPRRSAIPRSRPSSLASVSRTTDAVAAKFVKPPRAVKTSNFIVTMNMKTIGFDFYFTPNTSLSWEKTSGFWRGTESSRFGNSPCCVPKVTACI